MKLVIVTPIFPPDIGGPATYVSELTSRLSSNHQITVITFSRSSSNKAITIPITGNFLTRQGRLFLAILNQARLNDVIYAQGTVVVGFMSLLVSLLMHKKFVLKFVGDEVWETEYNSGKTQFLLEEYYQHKTSLLIWLHRLVLHQAHTIIVPSNYLKNFLIDSHHVNPINIHVISNAITRFTTHTSRLTNTLVTVGRLVKTKNTDLIIDALAIARKQKPWQLVIIGDGPEKERLKLKIKNLKLKRAVTFTGSLTEPDVSDYMAKAHALILMSNYEGQSHTLLRALEQGTPIIASDIEPNRELIQKSGSLVPLNNPEMLARAINQPQKKAIKIDFSWDKHLRQLISVLSL